MSTAASPAFASGLVNPPSSLVKSSEKLPDGSAVGYGSAVAAIGDLDGDGVTEFAVGAKAANGNSGGVWILRMQHNGSYSVLSQLTSITPQLAPLLRPDDEFGASVAAIGDLDGDGVPDIAVGAPNDDDVAGAHAGGGLGINRGAVYIILLGSGGAVKAVHKLSDLTPGMNLPSDFERFGAAITSLGNFDGVGPAKLVLAVGAPGDRDADVGTGFMRGAVYELFLTFNGALAIDHVVKLSDTQGTPAALHLHDADLFGSSLAALADMNGDGVADLAVGAPLDDDNIDGDAAPGANRGAVYVMLLNADGTVNRHQKISATSGGFAAHLGRSDFFGDGVAAMPDLDQNGVRDLAVGSGGNDDGASGAGAAWVVLLDYDSGSGSIFVKMPLRISNNSGNLGGGLNADDGFGTAVASIGDLDLDGFPDLLAGVPGDGGGPSSAWVVNLGRSSVTLASSLNPAPAGADVQFTATVNPGSGGVYFRDAGTTLAGASLSAGQASFTTNALIGGSHPMTADVQRRQHEHRRALRGARPGGGAGHGDAARHVRRQPTRQRHRGELAAGRSEPLCQHDGRAGGRRPWRLDGRRRARADRRRREHGARCRRVGRPALSLPALGDAARRFDPNPGAAERDRGADGDGVRAGPRLPQSGLGTGGRELRAAAPERGARDLARRAGPRGGNAGRRCALSRHLPGDLDRRGLAWRRAGGRLLRALPDARADVRAPARAGALIGIHTGAGGGTPSPAFRASVTDGAAPVKLRPAGPADETFLLALYRSTREDELALTGWDETQRDAFVRMQFNAQRHHYAAAYPDAAHDIIVRDGREMGRLLVARDGEQVHLVDVALLPEHRGAGIGEALVRGLIAEADARGVPVRLSVLKSNRALRLYQRLGFEVAGESGMHFQMERPPGR